MPMIDPPSCSSKSERCQLLTRFSTILKKIFGVQRASAIQALRVSFIFLRLSVCISSPTLNSFQRGGPSTAAAELYRPPSSIQLQAVVLSAHHLLDGVARVSTRLPLFQMIQSSGNRGYVFSLRQVLDSLADVLPPSPCTPRIP